MLLFLFLCSQQINVIYNIIIFAFAFAFLSNDDRVQNELWQTWLNGAWCVLIRIEWWLDNHAPIIIFTYFSDYSQEAMCWRKTRTATTTNKNNALQMLSLYSFHLERWNCFSRSALIHFSCFFHAVQITSQTFIDLSILCCWIRRV